MTYDYLITIKKGLLQAGFVAAAAGITALTNYFIALPAAENAIYFPFLIVVLNMLQNYVKHYKDV